MKNDMTGRARNIAISAAEAIYHLFCRLAVAARPAAEPEPAAMPDSPAMPDPPAMPEAIALLMAVEAAWRNAWLH